MKNLVFIFLAVFYSVSMFADNNNEKAEEATTNSGLIEGVVIDANTGEAITGAVVTLDNSGAKTHTDFDGKFSFKKSELKNSTVTISFISYKNKTIKIDEVSKSIKVKLQQ